MFQFSLSCPAHAELLENFGHIFPECFNKIISPNSSTEGNFGSSNSPSQSHHMSGHGTFQNEATSSRFIQKKTLVGLHKESNKINRIHTIRPRRLV